MNRLRPRLLGPAFALMLMTVGALPALAGPVKGTVVSIDYYTVRVVVVGKLPSWVKQGHSVRFLEIRSLVVGVSADTVTIGSPNTGKTSVGAQVTLKKWKPDANGC